ncbi:MAG: hypothetical protein Q8928_17965 [Bacteroidota bacterium]|nr:hypothetical protein [Bacteroidota bacterium]
MILRTAQWLFPAVTFISLMAFTRNANGQENAQAPLNVRAQLVDQQTLRPVAFAHIINKTRHTGTSSDTLGIFTLRAFPRDSLFISTIGYFPLTLAVVDSLSQLIRIPKIKLKARVYNLADVEIYSLGTYQEFKHKVLTAPLPENKTQSVITQINKELGMIPKHALQEQASIPLGSPVTALYMFFSKEGRQLRRLEKAKERDKLLNAVSGKYNRNVVTYVTGLTGEMLEQFMKFCQPDDTFVVGATEYELYRYIYQCYDKFMESLGNPSKK